MMQVSPLIWRTKTHLTTYHHSTKPIPRYRITRNSTVQVRLISTTISCEALTRKSHKKMPLRAPFLKAFFGCRKSICMPKKTTSEFPAFVDSTPKLATLRQLKPMIFLCKHNRKKTGLTWAAGICFHTLRKRVAF